jgi:type IV secretory pathway VirB10-like protein
VTTPPKENPEALELRARPKPVTRLNRKFLTALVGGLAVAVLFAFMWGLRTPKSKNSSDAPEKRNVDRVTKAEGLESLPRDYASLPKPPALGAPSGELGRPVLRAEQEAGIPELPETPNFRPNPEDDAVRARRLKEQSEADEAGKAPMVLQLKSTHALTSSATTAPPNAQVTGENSTASQRAEVDPNKQGTKIKFIEKEPDSRIYASATLQSPRSPYQLMSGSIIPAALVTGIQSDLPGETIASVTENVYDSVTGRLLLIPQGSRLIGQYDSQVAYGQRRVLVVWTRLIMPDGSSIVLDRLPGADTQGYAGLEDKVNWHWGRLFAGAAVSTLLGVNAALVTNNAAGNNGSVVIATRQSAQDTVNQVGQELTRRNLDIQPTLTERPGLPLRIVVNRDLVLNPYGS